MARTVYSMRPVEDECAEASWATIADELGRTRSTVERLGRRALRRLWREQVNPAIAQRIARGRKPRNDLDDETVAAVLAACGGHLGRTAQHLGVARTTLRRRLQRLVSR